MADISLRRAAKLRSRMENRLRELESELTSNTILTVNVYDPDVATQFGQQQETFLGLYARYVALSRAVSSFRGLISQTNARVQVDTMLAMNAQVNRHLQILRKLVNVAPRPSDDQIRARLDGAKIEAAAGTSRYGSGEVSYTLLTKDVLDQLDAEAKGLVALSNGTSDSLEAANSTTMLGLTDDIQAILDSEGLL